MSDYTAENISVVKLRLAEFAQNEAKKEVVKRMHIIASRMIDYIDNVFKKGDQNFPEWTANLHDATGIGIYIDGHLDKYMPTARASKPQKSEIGEDIWGTDELSEALNMASSKFSKGLWLVLFSAVDYADQIERIGSPKERGVNFFTALAEQVGFNVTDEFGSAIVEVSGKLKNMLFFM